MKAVEFFTSAEATFFLRLHLGPCLDWRTYIADQRRDKLKKGPKLHPYGRSDYRGQPLYLKTDVEKFVAEFREYRPDEAMKGLKPQVQEITIEEPKDWRDKVLGATSTAQ
jgi:hypothetical protein